MKSIKPVFVGRIEWDIAYAIAACENLIGYQTLDKALKTTVLRERLSSLGKDAKALHEKTGKDFREGCVALRTALRDICIELPESVKEDLEKSYLKMDMKTIVRASKEP